MKSHETNNLEKNSGISILSQHETSARLLYGGLISQSETSVDSDNNWLITLSDVLTLLLVFLIMFLIMTKNTTGYEKAKHDNSHNIVLPEDNLEYETGIIGRGIRDEITSKINNLDLGGEVSVLATSRGIIITMREKVTFRPGEAEILISSKPVLDNIAEIIQRHPNFLVEIDGHTDNIPIKTHLFPSNWELSVARATSVLKYFINYQSINPSRLSIKGNADQKPIVPNDTPENRAKNRRVEIRLKEY